jgi:DNA-binding MarR family transcriptional regulator
VTDVRRAGAKDTAAGRAAPRVSYVVGRLDRALSLAIGARVAPHGVTLGEYVALSLLSRQTGLSNAQLARRSLVRPQSMMEVIAALERKGLIEREPDANHRRILRARVTRRGRGVLAACDSATSALEDEMLADLDDGPRDELLRALVACVRRLGAGLDDV